MKNQFESNRIDSAQASTEVLKELIPYYYGSDEIDSREIMYAVIMFERLLSFNFKVKPKPHSPVWEERIVSFAEGVAKQLKYEAKYNPPKIVRYDTDTENP
jgi:hypothetical protein